MAWYHQLTAKILSRFPWVYEKFTSYMASDIPVDVPSEPWTAMDVDPYDASLMLVTSGGVHGPEQEPFDMSNPRGDASCRWIPSSQRDFTITHDYYDHDDADEDVNCLFPLPLAARLSDEGLIGPLVDRHLGFMGHVEDPLLPELMHETLPEVWKNMTDPPDLILLSPG